MEDLTKQILEEQPEDVITFAAEYLKGKLHLTQKQELQKYIIILKHVKVVKRFCPIQEPDRPVGYNLSVFFDYTSNLLSSRF